MEEEDLKILIKCDCNECHDWMAFASYYSIKKNLPESSIFLSVNLKKPIFRWSNRFNVKIVKGNTGGYFVIKPTVMAVRPIRENIGPFSSKTNIASTFVDYEEGCGNFVVDKWINTKKIPFYNALKRFGKADLTINEMAILKIWQQCDLIYQAAGVT